MISVPEDFLFRMKNQLGDSLGVFLDSLLDPPPVSVRFNSSKSNSETLKQYISSAIPWAENAFYLNERPKFTLNPLFHAGAFYVQEASSMLVNLAFPKNDDPKLILDLCAAPGGKTTHIASLMNDNSVLIANEVIKSRKAILEDNVIRWGNPNVVVTSFDSTQWAKSGLLFDFILVDAPCSGEGLWRKDHNAIKEWSLNNVQFCSDRQKRILSDAVKLLNNEGRLVYSTCTFSEEENLQNILFILNNNPNLSLIQIEMDQSWGVSEVEIGTFGVGYMCYPHKVKGEGFFMCVIQNKTDTTQIAKFHSYKKKSQQNNYIKIPVNDLKLLQTYLNNADNVLIENINGFFRCYPRKNYDLMKQMELQLKNVYGGIYLGELKGTDYIPSHDLAMSNLKSKRTPSFELTYEQAIRFLKKELLDVSDAGIGWQLATYQGVSLGWFKKINGRINNHLPLRWRIRMDVNNEL